MYNLGLTAWAPSSHYVFRRPFTIVYDNKTSKVPFTAIYIFGTSMSTTRFSLTQSHRHVNTGQIGTAKSGYHFRQYLSPINGVHNMG